MFPDLTYATLIERATKDPAVAGLVLKGSRAHDGTATEHSDHDVYVVVFEDADTPLRDLHGHRDADLDIVVTTVEEFRRTDGFERYGLSRARVVLDLDGEIAGIVAALGRRDADEASAAAAQWLDAYANSLYRSVKNARDGFPLAARLDATDSIGFLLELLFALDRRPRPYNKYLAWELDRFPLPGWEAAPLLQAITRITATGDPALQRALFTRVEPHAREANLGPTLDAWGEDLLLMRPATIVTGMAVPEQDSVSATSEAYDAVAELYAQKFRDSLQDSPLERACLSAFADFVGEGGRVADLGCGPGHVTAYLAESGLAAFGVDASPAMVDLARRAYPGLRFDVGPMSALDIEDGALDGVLSRWSIIHTPPPELPAILREFSRILKPGGQLLLGFSATDGPTPASQVYDHAVAPAYRWWPDHLAGMLREHGFTEVARTVRAPQPTDRRQHREIHLFARKG